jgi:RNA polymerase-interacting CarD/CdnL/TRCF family regulator
MDQVKVVVDDVIVDCFQIYKVFKISKVVNNKGIEEDLVFYKPFLKNNDLVCSIPFRSFNEAGLRKLMTRKEIEMLLKELSDKNQKEILFDKNIKTIKDVLYLNDPMKTVNILKFLWQKSKAQDKTYPKSDQEIFNIAMNHLIDEVALVYEDSESAARELVMAAINKS